MLRINHITPGIGWRLCYYIHLGCLDHYFDCFCWIDSLVLLQEQVTTKVIYKCCWKSCWALCHVWLEFVGSPLCFEGFPQGFQVFLPLPKSTPNSNSNFIEQIAITLKYLGFTYLRNKSMWSKRAVKFTSGILVFPSNPGNFTKINNISTVWWVQKIMHYLTLSVLTNHKVHVQNLQNLIFNICGSMHLILDEYKYPTL